jgi:hypothetical protein
MRSLLVLACAFALPAIVFAADHGPVFGYATPVNSEREFSFDSGIFGRSGSLRTQLSSGSGFGYGLTPQLRDGDACAADDPATCAEASWLSRIFLWGSAVVWSCGFCVAYLLGPILEHLDR